MDRRRQARTGAYYYAYRRRGGTAVEMEMEEEEEEKPSSDWTEDGGAFMYSLSLALSGGKAMHGFEWWRKWRWGGGTFP